jgi:hypothetical protein
MGTCAMCGPDMPRWCTAGGFAGSNNSVLDMQPATVQAKLRLKYTCWYELTLLRHRSEGVLSHFLLLPRLPLIMLHEMPGSSALLIS